MKRVLFFLTPLIMLWMCQAPAKLDVIGDVSAIKGLASPIQLNVDTTDIRLLDYFADLNGITEVSLAGEMLHWDANTGITKLTHGLSIPLSSLRILKNGIAHDIPVFGSSKVLFTFVYPDSTASLIDLAIAGSMNGWNPSAGKCVKTGNEWRISWWLNPGVFQYQLVKNGVWCLDDQNPNQMPNGNGGTNSAFTIGDPERKAPFLFTSAIHGQDIVIQANDELVGRSVYWNNMLINSVMEGSTITFTIPQQASTSDRSFLRVYAHDGQLRANDVLIPLINDKVLVESSSINRTDYHKSIMYFMMVDRFADGNVENNRPTLNDSILAKANNMGGDLSGITSKVQDNYIKSIGANTLWISPITKNAEGAWGLWTKGVTSKFSAYHGYWPTGLRQVDDRMGTAADLTSLLEAAHAQDMNVILDYVAHHVHQEHPLFTEHPDWVTSLYLPDGTLNTERWDEHRLTTWFDLFLPTWDFSRPEVREALADSAMYWLKEFELDGFRHDATKHVQEEFWRELTSRVKSEIDRPIYQIGETYGNSELIGSYVNSGEMDGQFDFNLYDAAVDAFANDDSGFENLGRVLAESLQAYGSHHLMGNITGNQDRARFASYADGSVLFSEDAKLAGWTREINNQGEQGFLKMQALMAFIMTIPGIPCIYYGDEIAMPGGNDPDNRRMMLFDGLNSNQLKTKEITSKLANLRAENMALLYGDTYVLKADQQDFVFLRKYFGQVMISWFHKGDGQQTSEVQLPEGIAIEHVSARFGHPIQLNGGTISMTFDGPGFEVIGN